MEQKRNQYFIHTDEEYGKLTVHWLRPVDAGKESLLTTRGKHRFYELHYVLQGGLTMCVAGARMSAALEQQAKEIGSDALSWPADTMSRELSFAENEFVLVPPDTNHEITDYLEHTIKLVFAFDAQLADPEAAARLSEADCSVKAGSSLFQNLARVLVDLESDSRGSEDTMAGLQMKCLTEAFFFELLRIVAPSATGGFQIYKKRRISHKQEFAQNMVEYIRSMEGKGFIKVGELAKAFHVDRRHLNRICMEAFGKTPKELIDEEKLRYICELLTTTDYTLGEIAFLSGFANEYSLSRFFEAHKGDAPGRYRKDGLK